MTPDEIQKDRAAWTLDDLNERVNAFSTLSLPGQMPMMHMGTSYLVNDLWKAVRTLTAENAALKERVADDYFGSLVTSARDAAEKATVKFPQPNYVTLKIAEEAGEVVRGAVHYAEGRMEWSEVEGEIVQLLAMLIRFVTEGDQINGITPPRSIGEKP